MTTTYVRALSTGDTINLLALLVGFVASLLSILLALATWRLHHASQQIGGEVMNQLYFC